MVVVRGHRLVGVPHDQVDSRLIPGFAADRFEGVPNRVKTATAVDSQSVENAFEGRGDGINTRTFFGTFVIRHSHEPVSL